MNIFSFQKVASEMNLFTERLFFTRFDEEIYIDSSN